MTTGYRAAWMAVQEDGTLITLRGADCSLRDAEAERDEVAALEYVALAWLEVSSWQQVDGSGKVGAGVDRVKAPDRRPPVPIRAEPLRTVADAGR